MRNVALAYNAIAPEYDQLVQGDRWMRKMLWRGYARLFQPGDRVLDVSCGTGIDALFLAARGVDVVGIDIAESMVAQLRSKAQRWDLTHRITAYVGDFTDLSVFPDSSFDGMISAFAGLNTTPDLTPFAADIARLLRPGRYAMLHMLNRFSLWEWLGFVWQRRWRAASDLRSPRERVFTIGGHAVEHHLYFADEAYTRFFSPYFQLRRAYGLGILRPPHTLRRIPKPVAQGLGVLEHGVASLRPFTHWGRFYVLELMRVP